MSYVSYEAISPLLSFLAVFCTGVGLTLMDDYLDEEGNGRWAGWLKKTGRGAVVYLIALFLLAASLRLAWTVTLFVASYAVGMTGDLYRRLPLGLKGGAEVLLVLVLAGFGFGWREIVSSLAVILFIQALDDLVDKRLDEERAVHNWALDWGETEVALLAGSSLFLGLAIDPAKVIMTILVALFLQYWKNKGKESLT